MLDLPKGNGTVLQNGWVVCPYCGKRQFPPGNAKIQGLEWRCRGCKKHFHIDTAGN